ncbi:DUF177 domain-containing protein [Aureimonas populi]|uniref:DUF177 domain-containing protein n=1 Tax=Aureimonas populi TaxID=1701758 RepID=A0ABW5CGY5_9HYPH|nr:DUF177 domain-containing protein [Aureimonas populi]
MQPDDPAAAEPLSCTVLVSRLPREGLPVEFEADEAEREALARFLGIEAVESLAAEVRVAPWRQGGVSVKGRLKAAAVQASVVTLEPVREEIDEEVDRLFIPENSKLSRIRGADEGEIHLDPEGDDIPDTFTGERLDLGAAFREIVAMSLDPYPREPDIVFEGDAGEEEAQDRPVSPFAALARLKSHES